MCETSSVALAGLADQLGWPGLLCAAVDGLVGLQTDELTEDELAATMRVVQTEQTRLGNLQALLFDARSRRVVKRGRDAHGGDANAGVRAARQLEQDVAGELGIGNGEAGRLAKAGKAIARDADAAAAAKQGRVSAEHLRVLDEKLRDVGDLGLQVRLRGELLAKAVELPLPAFRRACDRAIAEADAAAAARAEDRRQARRSAKTFETDDGMLGLSARLAGLGAETVATAIDAYRTPDAADQRRRPEQRTADALVDMATVALRHIDSTAHGHPPQVLVTIDRDSVRTGRGVAETVWTGPLPATTVRRLLDDAQITTLTHGRQLPTTVVSHTRAVPSGLWRLLVARDRGCVADGCDVPPGWCDIVHLHVDHHPGGRLSEANAALACRRHHRAYDHPTRPLVAIWHDDRPTLIRRSQVPDGARRTPPDHLIPESGLQGPVPARAVPVIDPATRRPTGRWLPAPATDRETDRGTVADTEATSALNADAVDRATATTDVGTSATDDAGPTDGSAASTTVAVTPDTTFGGTGPVTHGRPPTGHDTDLTGAGALDGYARHRTADQPSLLAEPHATYRSGAGPPTARSRGPTVRRYGHGRSDHRGRDGPGPDPRHDPDRPPARRRPAVPTASRP